jgi:hypothetical protein
MGIRNDADLRGVMTVHEKNKICEKYIDKILDMN